MENIYKERVSLTIKDQIIDDHRVTLQETMDFIKKEKYESFSVNGVRDISSEEEKLDGSTAFESCEDKDADMWSVYGFKEENSGSDCLADCTDRESAEMVAEWFNNYYKS